LTRKGKRAASTRAGQSNSQVFQSRARRSVSSIALRTNAHAGSAATSPKAEVQKSIIQPLDARDLEFVIERRYHAIEKAVFEFGGPAPSALFRPAVAGTANDWCSRSIESGHE
jgi:hypothetical protein